MIESRKAIVATIRKYLPGGLDPSINVGEETSLASLGVQSMHLISLVLKLHAEQGLDINAMEKFGMPITVGDLVRMIEGNSPAVHSPP